VLLDRDGLAEQRDVLVDAGGLGDRQPGVREGGCVEPHQAVLLLMANFSTSDSPYPQDSRNRR
jgi:hypothetical protein